MTQLVYDLKKDRAPVELWLDEQDVGIGQSITSTVSEAIEKTNYLILVHSRNSAESSWVKWEVEAATNLQISGGGIVVIAAILDKTPLPIMLRDRLGIDFITNYAEGYQKILNFFRDEAEAPQSELRVEPRGGDDCPTRLGALPLGELRRRMQKGLSRNDVEVAWFDIFNEKMDDYLPGKAIDACLVELLLRCRRYNLLRALLQELCENWPHVAN